MKQKTLRRRRVYDGGAAGSAVAAAPALTCALLMFLIGYIFYRGVPGISWQLLTTARPAISTIPWASCPTFCNTLYIILVAMVIVAAPGRRRGHLPDGVRHEPAAGGASSNSPPRR